MSSSYNPTNAGMYGSHTPHMSHVQTPTNLPPPPLVQPPQPMMTWNGIHMVPPPHPHHQTPYNPMPNHPPNLLNAPQNRQQFNPQGIPHLGHPLPCQQPPPAQLHCHSYGHYPTSQFILPIASFPAGEMFHQGYVTAGGPFSTHQNEGFYHHPMADHNVRQMHNFMAPPANPQMNFNQRPPMHTQQGFGPSPLFDQVLQQGNTTPWRNDLQDTGPQHHYKSMFPTDGNFGGQGMFGQGMFDPLHPPQVHDSFATDAANHRSFSLHHNPSRTATPSMNILERNTAANFDESSEELAEIFGDKSSQTNPPKTRGSSNASSNRSTPSGCVLYSDDEGFDDANTMDTTMGSSKDFKECPMNQCCTEGLPRDSKCHEPHPVKHTHIRPPPGFSYLKEVECPTEEQLHKVGHIIKGLLKIEAQGHTTCTHEGNTIRSMIDKPIYSNCESRLIRQEPEIQKREKQTEHVSVLSNGGTGQRRYTQQITSHFRLLFEPLPDMFQDDIML